MSNGYSFGFWRSVARGAASVAVTLIAFIAGLGMLALCLHLWDTQFWFRVLIAVLVAVIVLAVILFSLAEHGEKLLIKDRRDEQPEGKESHNGDTTI